MAVLRVLLIHTGVLAMLAACAVAPVRSIGEFARRGQDNSFEVFNRPVRGPKALVLDVAYDQQANRVACGALVLACVIRYWKPGDAAAGAAIFAGHPPADPVNGYSLQEIITLAKRHDLNASGVRFGPDDIIAELEKGRPVMIPVRLPSIYVQTHTFFDPDPVVIGQIKNIFLGCVAFLSSLTGLEMLSHYVLVVGHGPDRFVLLDPILGYRTISRSRLAGYRKAFADAAIVFSAPNLTESQPG
jgi:hypothetical protein